MPVIFIISVILIITALPKDVAAKINPGIHNVLELDNNKKNKIELQKKILYDNYGRPKKQKSTSSKSGKFRINYFITGEHAVDRTDNDNNGFPDFVDSVGYYLDRAYFTMVRDMGFISPVPEDHLNISHGLYNVYLWDLGNHDEGIEYGRSPKNILSYGGVYGLAQPYQLIYNEKSMKRVTSYIVLDNDFSEGDIAYNGNEFINAYKTTGYEALKITAAHEFHHAIQLITGITDYNAIFSEMTSVLMEKILYPEVKDYIHSINTYLQQPQEYVYGINESYLGYGASAFLIMLEEKYGKEFIKLTWDLISEGNNCFVALENVLKNNYNSTGIEDEFEEFGEWMVFTGHRKKDNLSGNCFLDAELMKTTKSKGIYEINNITQDIQSELRSFTFETFKFPLQATKENNDTLLALVINNNPKWINNYREYKYMDYKLNINGDKQDNNTRILNTDYFYNYTQNKNLIIKFFKITKQEITKIESLVSPNPYLLSRHKYVQIDVSGLKDAETAGLMIYSSNSKMIHQTEYEILKYGDKQYIVVNDPKIYSPGVYFYMARSDNNKIVYGKFIIRK